MTARGAPRPPRLSWLRGAVRAARSVPRGWWAWTSDYAYVVWRQVRGALAPGDPARFSTGSEVPVVLLPGVYETWFFLEPLARVLHGAGHPVVTVPGLGRTTAGLEELSAVLAERLDELGLRRVVLVAHSKGGLVGKHLMSQAADSDLDGRGTDGRGLDSHAVGGVVGMVALNTPFDGSRYATFFPSRTVRALSPRFPAMRSLAQEVTAHGRIVSVYGLFDPHVPGGSALAGATNVRLPVMGHFRTVANPVVQRAVLEHVDRLGRSSDGRTPPAHPDGGAAT